jgi:hypothetical protein
MLSAGRVPLTSIDAPRLSTVDPSFPSPPLVLAVILETMQSLPMFYMPINHF